MHFTSACAASDVEPGEVEADEKDGPRSPAGQPVYASRAARGHETDGQAPWAPFRRPGLRRRDPNPSGAGGDHGTQAVGSGAPKEDGEGPRGAAGLVGEGRERGHRWRHGEPYARLV